MDFAPNSKPWVSNGSSEHRKLVKETLLRKPVHSILREVGSFEHDQSGNG
jgi:hypothetical protein